jgi:hypothetical protein
VDPDPDPLETIEPLSGITVSMGEDGRVVFTFADSQHGGVGVQLTGLAEGQFSLCSWLSTDEFTGEGEGTSCFAQSAEGFFGVDPLPNGPAPTMSVLMDLVVTTDTVSITIDGTTFTGDGLRFDDGPVFVQIDPSTGELSEPVTRRTGTITAAELFAALNG